MESKNSNYYFIEKVAEKDLIGFEEYLNALNEVIRNGATFIGLISDYGTGKSSLLNMLSNNIAYKVVFINLWNYQKEEINTLDIHKIFLHQLIDKLDINNKNYFKKKINQNYNIIDFCIKKRKYTWYIYFIDLCLFIIFVLSSFPILMKFILFLIALFLFGFYKPLISFNKNDSLTRKIDENDTKDLFAEIINEYFKNKENKNIKLLICLEELDRYNNYELVVEYLKEFYKFYSENSNNRNISFIVSVKSASQLIELSQDNIELKELSKKYKIEYVKDLYEKIFDFILNLNFINIQDYDSILIALLSNKELPEGIKFNKTNLINWRWLYMGKNIKIRDIKHRFNFAINLYLSAKESGLESPDIKKCLFISYLEDEFNLFYNKLVNENLIGKILIDYVNKKLDNEKYKLHDDEYKILKDALDSKLISIDYNYYFYKYPKVKESFNLNEYVLYNAIFYDEDSIYINNAIKKLSDDQIYKIINKRIDELLLPKVLFRYPKLFMVAYYKLNKSFEYTIDKRFNIMNNFENFKEYYSYIKNLRKNYHKNLLSEYFKKYKRFINR